MSANIGWLFFKDYFKDINYNNLKDKTNEIIIQKKVKNLIEQSPLITEQKDEDLLGNVHFKASTTYPGLLLGSGNAHELPSIEGQAILGFHFDYASGLPTIQGSSIKGVLRSAFKHWEYIAEYTNLTTQEQVKNLEKEVFDNGDVFYDATIIKTDALGKILGEDFLTPHGDNPLKNPIPLRFIKVLPDVTFRFDFDFIDGIISKQSKSKLFQNILEDLGLGAKTNVGYGKLEKFQDEKTESEKVQEQEENKKRLEKLKKEQEEELQRQRDEKEQAEIDKKTRLEAEKKVKENEEKAKKEAFFSQGIEAIIADCTKFAKLSSDIKKYIELKPLTENEKDILEQHMLQNMNDKIKKKKFPFGTFVDERCFGKERANNIVDRLGLE